jgi:HK97 family phage major capsid protein
MKCKKCQKDLLEGAKFCPDCGEAVAENAITVDAIKDAVKTTVQTEIGAFDARLKKIEAMPVAAARGDVNVIVPKVYRGYKIHRQGLELREKFVKRPQIFQTLGNMANFDKFAEFLIDVKNALLGDLHSAQKLQKFVEEEKTAMAEGTDAVGGYLVPVEYEFDLVKLARDASFALQKCTVIPMSSSSLKLPSELTLPSVTWPGEAGQGSATNPTFGQVTLTAKKVMALTDYLSRELLSDSGVDIVSLLTEQIMYAIGLELDNQVLNGTGNPVSGVLTAAAGYSVVMATGSTSFSAVSANTVRDMIRKLSAADAAEAEFIYSKDIQYYIDTLKDTNGRYLYREPSGDRPAALWNRGIFESAKAPAESASAASTAFAVLGVWKKFYLGQRSGEMALSLDPYTKFDYDQVRFRLTQRWALAVARSTAFCRAITAA